MDPETLTPSVPGRFSRIFDLGETVIFWLVLASVFLLPIFFLPVAAFPFLQGKLLFFTIPAILAFLLWVKRSIMEKTLSFPKCLFIVGALLIAITAFVSTMLSGSPITSFIADGADFGTSAFLAAAFFALFALPPIFSNRKRIFSFHLAFLLSAAVLALFHIARFVFGAGFLSFGVFGDLTSNAVGTWNSVAIFAGASAVLSLLTLEFVSAGKAFKMFLMLLLAASVAVLVAVNFSIAWVLVALFALGFGLYLYFLRTENSEGGGVTRRIPVAAVIVFIVGALCIAFNGPIGSTLANRFGISNIDARPQWTTTARVTKAALTGKTTLFGVGPNRFSAAWLAAKPAAANATPFWNTDFNYGVGFVPTFLATTGIVGGLAWLIFFIGFLLLGIRALRAPAVDELGRSLLVSSFLISLYLWIAATVYPPGPIIISLTVLWSALFLSTAVSEGIVTRGALSLGTGIRRLIISILVGVLGLGSVALGYVFVQKALAASYYNQAISSLNQGGTPLQVEGYFLKAIAHSPTGTYYRALSAFDVYELNQIATAANAQGADVKSLQDGFQKVLTAALGNASAAIGSDQTDYRNWVSLGAAYEAVTPLGVQNAYENAANNYKKALALNPKGPAMELNLARLEVAHNTPNAATPYLQAALAMKPDYTAALVLAAQIQFTAKDTKGGIQTLVAAVQSSPNDIELLYQLGSILYATADYQDAIVPLERAVSITPTYSNARYYLGLSYDKLGRKPDAIVQFKAILAANPDSAEVKAILANLAAGKPALSGVSAAAAPDAKAATTTKK